MSQIWREKRNKTNSPNNSQHKKSNSTSYNNYNNNSNRPPRSSPKGQYRSYDDHHHPPQHRDDRDERENGKPVKREDPEVIAVKKATGGYFKNAAIVACLNSLDWNVDECIRTLNDKRKNSWSNVVNPVSSPQVPIQSTPQAENTKKKNKTNKKHNDNSHSNQQQQNGNTSQQNRSQQTQSHSQTQTHQTPAHKVEENLTSADFEIVERSLSEKQVQLNRETVELNSLLNDIKFLREKKSNKLGSLSKEKEQLEEKKKQIEEDYNKVTFHLKDVEDRIQNLEKEFNQQFISLSKKAEHFQSKMLSH